MSSSGMNIGKMKEWKCKPGCKGECCGPVGIPSKVFDKHGGLIKKEVEQ